VDLSGLAGLIYDQGGESSVKVPLLGAIPVLGHLFKYTSKKKQKRYLMIVIRPTILRVGMASDGVSQRKYIYIRAEQLYRADQGMGLMPQPPLPVLPECGTDPQLPREGRDCVLARWKRWWGNRWIRDGP
ncbi:hypothetical protein J2R62_18480, partial [Plesiomonas shigelloides]|nr:hypothetical protein [Plesiomonas shigelloides]